MPTNPRIFVSPFSTQPSFYFIGTDNHICRKHHKSKSGVLLRNYKLLPLTNFDKILSYFNANRSQFIETTDFEHLISILTTTPPPNAWSQATFRTRLPWDTLKC